MSALVEDILRDQQAMESARSGFDSLNQRIAELIWPGSALFGASSQTQGERRDSLSFDSTASLALPKFAAAAESILIPRTQQYQSLAAQDDALNDIPSVKAYCEELTRAVFKARYAPRAGFTFASGEGLQSLGAFGSSCIYVDESPGAGLRYRYLFSGSIWFNVDHTGTIDQVHRKFRLTARQAAQKFGVDSLPEDIKKALEKSPSSEFDFIHCVKPREDMQSGRLDYRGMKYASYYVSTSGKEILQEGGFRRMPYICSRFSTAPGETYGRGPAASALSTLNLINEQARTILRAGQRTVDPPIMTPDDDALEAFNLKAGAINRGFISADGSPLAVPFNSGANIPIGLEMVQDSREVINDAFFVTLFRILVEEPQKTATEALLRAQEKGELLGPTVGRQQEELLSPLIERELELLSQSPGALPEMPPELVEAGGIMAVVYDSPLNKLQRSSDGVAIMNWVQSMTPFEQSTPGTLAKIVDIGRLGKELAEIQGVPASVLLTDDEKAGAEDAEAQQRQAEMLLQAAPVAGKAALDLTKAQQLANAQPSAATLL